MVISFEKGLKYPWGKGMRLWNILWILVPVLGVFAVIGYIQKIVKTLVKGDFSGLPAFGKFWESTKKGFMLAVKIIPTAVVIAIVNMIPVIGWIAYAVIAIFLLPWLLINFLVHDKFSALWEIGKAGDVVFSNIKDYAIAFLKQVVYSVIYGVASIILVGIPCVYFGSAVYLAEFYSKHK